MTLSAIKNARNSKIAHDLTGSSQAAAIQSPTQFSNTMSRPTLASMVADLDETVTIDDNSEAVVSEMSFCALPEPRKRQNSQ